MAACESMEHEMGFDLSSLPLTPPDDGERGCRLDVCLKKNESGYHEDIVRILRVIYKDQ